MQARAHRVHRASVAGGTANTGIKPDQRLLLDAVPARFGVVPVEIASEQSLEVSKFELDDGFAIRPDAFTNWPDEKPVDNSLID